MARNYNFSCQEDNQFAKNWINLRGLLIVFQLVGLIGPLLLYGAIVHWQTIRDTDSWFARNSDEKLHFACERPLDPSVGCPNWTKDIAGKCAFLGDQKASQDDAAITCAKAGSKLLTIDNKDQNAAVYKHFHETSPLWLGVWQDKEGEWRTYSKVPVGYLHLHANSDSEGHAICFGMFELAQEVLFAYWAYFVNCLFVIFISLAVFASLCALSVAAIRDKSHITFAGIVGCDAACGLMTFCTLVYDLHLFFSEPSLAAFASSGVTTAYLMVLVFLVAGGLRLRRLAVKERAERSEGFAVVPAPVQIGSIPMPVKQNDYDMMPMAMKPGDTDPIPDAAFETPAVRGEDKVEKVATDTIDIAKVDLLIVDTNVDLNAAITTDGPVGTKIIAASDIENRNDDKIENYAEPSVPMAVADNSVLTSESEPLDSTASQNAEKDAAETAAANTKVEPATEYDAEPVVPIAVADNSVPTSESQPLDSTASKHVEKNAVDTSVADGKVESAEDDTAQKAEVKN